MRRFGSLSWYCVASALSSSSALDPGHFEIFDYLNQEGALFEDEAGLRKGEELIDKIQPSTELILDFNEKYLITDDLDSLIIDLATIGETLAKRFDQEDTLIDVLHSAHVGKLLDESQPDIA